MFFVVVVVVVVFVVVVVVVVIVVVVVEVIDTVGRSTLFDVFSHSSDWIGAEGIFEES